MMVLWQVKNKQANRVCAEIKESANFCSNIPRQSENIQYIEIRSIILNKEIAFVKPT